MLIHGVLEAFLVSACAILLAMMTTFLEKLAISRRVQQVEEFCNLLDSLFDSGAGEEYLSRLVKASESSATQAAQLKDALISDLKSLLAETTRQQSEAIAASFHQITQQHVAAIAEGARAQVQTTEQSGDRIATAISEVLSDPIQKIAAAVQSTSDTNGQVVTRALNEALVAFSQKLEEMFGSQMTNMNQLLMQTTASLQATVSRFDELAANINHAGKNAADAMGERLTEALESMEKRQELLNGTMSDFVAQLRDMVQSSQTETNQRLQEAFSLMGERLSAIVSQMEEQARKASSSHQEQQELLAQNATRMASEMGGQIQGTLASIQAQFAEMVQALQVQNAEAAIANEETQRRMAQNSDQAIHGLADKVENTIGNLDAKMSDFVGMLKQQLESTASTQKEVQREITERVQVAIELLTNQVQALVAETNRSVASMLGATAAMREITDDSTRRMEQSAETLAIAADDFAKAGSSVSGVMTQAGQVGEKLSTTAGSLSSAAAVVNTALTDYQESREAITRMVSELKVVVDAAKQDATVSQSLVNQITRSAEQLEKAHSSVEGLFEGVCNELAGAHDAFARNVEDTLKKSNGAFQKELKDAVDYLKTAIEELGDVAEAIPGRR
jgi:ABC-type transporter Mla subunit MlaD